MALFVVGCSEKSDEPTIPYEELPYFCDAENLSGWSNARICKDGNAIFTSQDAATRQVEKTLMFVKADTLGFVAVYGEFDETGFPKSLAFDDAVILIDNHTETTFGATLFIEGEAVWTAAELELPAQASRAWNDNNWVRNTCAVGGVITSSIGIGVGVALTGTGFGTMTGLVTIATSCGALTENLGVLFGPAEEGGGLSAEVEQYIQDKGWDNLCDGLTEHEEKFLNKWFSEHMDALDRLSWVDLALDLIDRTWGKTVTESDKRLALILAHRSYVIETGVAKDVTEHTAELWGYVTPEALAPLGNYAEIEYGIVVYPTADPSNRMHKEYIVGDGGAFSLLFRGLEYDTEYSYFVYYNDKTNALPRYGQTRTFKTVGEDDDLREMLIKFYHDTGGDNWTRNDNWCSDKPIDEWYGVNYSNSELMINLWNNNLTGSGDLSGCTAIEYLNCCDNQLTSLDISGCTALRTLVCINNQLTSLDVSGCTALRELLCDYNQLTSLNVSGCAEMQGLHCYFNQLTSLDVSGFTALEDLDCDHNQLTALNVSGCTALEELHCDYNQFTSLNVSGCTALEKLHCNDNQLTSLDVSGCTALEELYCYDNQLTSLDVSNYTKLMELSCCDNQLVSLNVSGCINLRLLECGEEYAHKTDNDIHWGNLLTHLDVTSCPALKILLCDNNQLTSLDVSNNPMLERLKCYNNLLTSLNVSGCTALKVLYCQNNPITQQITPQLSTLRAYNNFICDIRYIYDWGEWYYSHEDHHGWYYPDEPYSGYVYGGVW